MFSFHPQFLRNKLSLQHGGENVNSSFTMDGGEKKKLDFEQILYYVHTSVYVVVYVLLDKCLLHSAVEWKRTMLVIYFFEKFSTQSLDQKFEITNYWFLRQRRKTTFEIEPYLRIVFKVLPFYTV